MWRKTDRANLAKKPSMRLSHEPCLGVKVNSKRPGGRASSQAVVIELDEEPAVVVREASPAFQLASQDDQLMSKHCILGLKPDVRLEWRGQHGQNEANQRDHRANLADSIIR